MTLTALHIGYRKMESWMAEHEDCHGETNLTGTDDSFARRPRVRKRNLSSLFHISASMLSLTLLSSYLPLAMPLTNADEATEPLGDDSSPFRIVIDAGSTGSRLHIFEMVASDASLSPSESSDDPSSSTTSARIECLRRGSSKAWTPLSAFAPSSQAQEENKQGYTQYYSDSNNEHLNATHVAHHMLPLFDYASIIIPQQFHSTTPVRIAATAGMRLISPDEQLMVYDALYEGLKEQQAPYGEFAFTDLKRCDVMTLDGEREAYFGAVAANYLRGVIDAELRVIVHPEDEPENDQDNVRLQSMQEGAQPDDGQENGMCTNKFKMCEQDAEDIVFGPSPHYVLQQRHDVRAHGPLGALDMGGSSTQIVYRRNSVNDKENGANQLVKEQGSTSPNEDGETNKYDIPSHLNDDEFFSTSYLSYGADQFRERLWDLWVAEARKQRQSNTDEYFDDISPVIVNPCSFVGYENEYRGFLLRGTGDAISCAEQINRLIPLLSHPPIHGKFYAMSLYFFTLDCLRELSDSDHPIHLSWPTPSIEELTDALNGFCSRSWQGDLEEVQHEAHEHTRAEVLPHRCVEAVYMVTLLRDGFGFHPSSRDITFSQYVDGNEVEWSLGMALSEFATERRYEEGRGTDII